MRICFISKGEPNAEQLVEFPSIADVTMYGFVEETVGYERELKGETHFFEDVARISKSMISSPRQNSASNSSTVKSKGAIKLRPFKPFKVSFTL